MITNEEVLGVNQGGLNPRLWDQRNDGRIVWVSDVPDEDAIYVALFNYNSFKSQEVTADLRELGFKGRNDVRNLWTKQVFQTRNGRLQQTLPSHGAALFKVSKVR